MTAPPTVDPAALHHRFSRNGTPTVVFVAGLGDAGDTWDAVRDAVSRHASTLTYDRAGVGRSPAVTGARTCGDLVEELARLLRTLDAPTTWLLVGRSFGGLVARLFAARHPHEVAGLVLVDAVVEHRELAPARRILEVDQRMQRDLARRSPISRNRMAAGSGHDVHHDERRSWWRRS